MVGTVRQLWEYIEEYLVQRSEGGGFVREDALEGCDLESKSTTIDPGEAVTHVPALQVIIQRGRGWAMERRRPLPSS